MNMNKFILQIYALFFGECQLLHVVACYCLLLHVIFVFLLYCRIFFVNL